MATIGVALAIPDPWGRQLQDYRVSLGDESARRIPAHITLVPPVDVDDDDLALVDKHLVATASETESYRVHLRGTGTFRPTSPVVFVSLVEGISQSEELADAVRSGPLAMSLAFPYHPHVTVAHRLDEEALDRAFREMADFECEFETADFHLYMHDDATGWQPTRRYHLAPPAGRAGGPRG